MDDEAVMAFYERTVSDVHRYASRLCGGNRPATEELVQNAYLALVKHVRAHPDDDIDLNWLIVDCRNRFVDRLPSDDVRARRETKAAALRQAQDAGEHEQVVMLRTLSGLSPDERFAIVLRYVDDLTVAQVAKALGRSVRATEAVLTRARAALHKATAEVVLDG